MTKNALITGASSGIGYALAKHLLDKGWDVTTVSRRDPGLVGATVILCDLTDANACEQVSKQYMHETLDLLVHAAGIATQKNIHSQDAEGWDLEFAMNVRPIFLLTRDFSTHLQQARGLVVNIASISGFEGSRSMPAYSASKHAVLGLGKSLVATFAGTGVRVTSLCPAYVATPMTAHVKDVRPEKMIQTDDIIAAVQMLLALSPYAHVPELEIRRIS